MSMMEERRVPHFSVDIFADRPNIKDVLKGVLHTIFWHRIFANQELSSHQEILDIALSYVQDVDCQTLIEQRIDALVRELEDPSDQNHGGRGQMVVNFSERRRRKGGWFGAKGDEELIWEAWTLNIALASPRTPQEISNTRRAMESSLDKAVRKITDNVDRNKDHVPPITTQEANAFPYQILINPKHDGWGQRMGIF